LEWLKEVLCGPHAPGGKIAHLIIVGSGAMGLAAAYYAIKAGHTVDVLEAAPEPGGMAAHFDFDGLSIERFYHFICKSDMPTFELMRELGIGDLLRWQTTSMGLFTGGRLYPWGDPISLLRFPEIGLISRLRYGFFAFVSARRENWDAIENESARSWITRWCGQEVFDRLWKPLLALKFYQYADDISAAWIWTRIKRIGRSRRSLFQEELGYIDGGSQVLVDALYQTIQKNGGKIRISCPAIAILSENSRVTGVETPEGILPADAVICTVPTPLISKLVPDLPSDLKAAYDAIHNTGICCLVFKLNQSVTPHFWVNVSESDIEIPGFIEFSNLRPLENTVVYVPYYMPTDHPKFSWSDQALLDQAFSYLQRVNPKLTRANILSSRVARLRYAQPVCEPGFAAKLPPIETPIDGLQIADTCFYYPEDRGISESVRLGKEMIGRVKNRW
jgi:protoporphyrinogen oxidase